MNKWIGTGRLTKDPELKELSGDTKVCNFTVAADRRFKKEGQSDADFIPCIAFNKTAEFINKYFEKGKMIAVDGSIQTRNWEDNEGKKHYSTEILVDNVEFCGSANDNNDGGAKQGKSTKETKPAMKSNVVEINDEEDPF